MLLKITAIVLWFIAFGIACYLYVPKLKSDEPLSLSDGRGLFNLYVIMFIGYMIDLILGLFL